MENNLHQRILSAARERVARNDRYYDWEDVIDANAAGGTALLHTEAALEAMGEMARFIIWLREEKGIHYREDLLTSKSNELWDLPRYYDQWLIERGV